MNLLYNLEYQTIEEEEDLDQQTSFSKENIDLFLKNAKILFDYFICALQETCQIVKQNNFHQKTFNF